MSDGRWHFWTPCGSFRRWVAAWWDAGPWILRAAEPDDRCYMGAPVTASVHCRRYAGERLWCDHHVRQLEREGIAL
jgi:hypothetical protein